LSLEQAIFDAVMELTQKTTEMQAEVKGTNQRLDILNGTVASHAKRFRLMDIEAAEKCGEDKFKKTIFGWLKKLWCDVWQFSKPAAFLFVGAMLSPLILWIGKWFEAVVQHAVK
jgi:hypothetical protein